MPQIMSSNPSKENLKIKHDDKFYSRLLSKESSSAPSFRVYYAGAASSVPFGWESQPGTPKNHVASAVLPPLTPPPSYHFTTTSFKNIKKPSLRSTLMHSILPRLTLRKSVPAPPPPPPPPPPLSVSTTSSSAGSYRRSRVSSSTSSFSSEEGEETSPTSILCFGLRHGSAGGVRGQQSGLAGKNTLLSLLGHDSGNSTA